MPNLIEEQAEESTSSAASVKSLKSLKLKSQSISIRTVSVKIVDDENKAKQDLL